MSEIKILFAGFLLVVLLLICFPRNSDKGKIVGCVMEIDSVFVKKNATAGGFSIRDTLFIPGTFQSFRFCYYDSMRLDFTYKRVDDNDGENCKIGQIVAPFWVHKKSGSDTLFVVQDGKEFIFKIPERFCGDPKDYFK